MRNVLIWLLLAGAAFAQQTGGWKQYNGPQFSFPYPPAWTLREPSPTSVFAFDPGSARWFGVEYLTEFGSDTAALLASERDVLRNVARDAAGKVYFDDDGISIRLGTAFSAGIELPNGNGYSYWVNAVPFGKAMYVFRMRTFANWAFSDREQFRDPMAQSVSFRAAQQPAIGTWQRDVRSLSTLVNGVEQSAPPRTFRAVFSLLQDGSYSYEVQQIDPSAPAWQLRMSGRYTAVSTVPAKDLGIALSLSPTQVQFVPIRGPVNQASELARLLPDGLPDTAPAVINLLQASTNELWIKTRNGGSDLHLQRTSEPTPSGLRVVNAASSKEGAVAPGSLISLFGLTMEATGVSAQALPLPVSLAGVSVTIGGRACPLLYVGREQINAQLPFEVSAGTTVSVSVVQNGKPAGSGTVIVNATSPGIFLWNGNRAVASNQDAALNWASAPARAGSVITVYYTGQGAFRTPVRTGEGSPANPLPYTAAQTTATIGGRPAVVNYSGGAPGFAEVSQANILVPAGLSRGDHQLILTIGGVASNPATISVAP